MSFVFDCRKEVVMRLGKTADVAIRLRIAVAAAMMTHHLC